MLRNFRKCWFGKVRNWLALSEAKAIVYLPQILFWLLATEIYILHNTKIYQSWYEVLNTIDTILFVLIAFYLILDTLIYKQYKVFTETNTIVLIVLSLVLLLQCGYWLFNIEFYKYLSFYKAIITSGILAIFISFVTKE